MKKLSILLGTLGGGLAGYLFSNKKLREELANAKDPEAAAKTLGKHLQHDGKKLAKQVQEFMESDEVQAHVQRAKKFAKRKVGEAKAEFCGMADKGKKRAAKVVKKGAKRAKKAVKRSAKSAKKAVTKKVKKTARRVRTTTRTLS